jgi:putative DNA primase/helicase
MFGIGAEFLSGRHGPCPVCERGNDRFRFDDKDGRGTYFCNQCGNGDGIKLVMLKAGLTFAEAAREIRERLGETTVATAASRPDPEQARQRAGGLWSGAFPNHGAHLRFCPSAFESDTRRRMPAMLGLVTAPDGQPVNVHRTFLENGRKAQIPAPRKMMRGEVPEGSAIRLGAHDGRLGIAEGIETALAVARQFGIVCWSAIDAGKMARFAVPADVRELHVFGDNDLKFAGQAAAYELARRASTMRDGPEAVTVRIPDEPGTDWADFADLRRQAARSR